MNFHNAALDLKDLIDNFNDETERIIDECLENGKILCDKWGLNLKEGREAKKMAGENVGKQVYRQQTK